MVKGFLRRGGAPMSERLAAMRQIMGQVLAAQGQANQKNDPLLRTRQVLKAKDDDRLSSLEANIRSEIQNIVDLALKPEGRSA